MSFPSVIFCSLQSSGGSAVDPILREVLAESGWFIAPYGPEGTQELMGELEKNRIKKPFYHWTHHGVEIFQEIIGSPDYRFIYMHRDPRDAAVSWAYDFKKGSLGRDMDFLEILEMIVTHNQPPDIKAAVEWTKSPCMVITYPRVKENTFRTVMNILDYVGYFDLDGHLSDTQVEEVVAKHSFEALTGRKSGEVGDIVRFEYMLRKGVSGEWGRYFSFDLLSKCYEIMGEEILALGYDFSPDLVDLAVKYRPKDYPAPTVISKPEVKKRARLGFRIVSPPFPCGVTWLINALLHLDIKVTNSGFGDDHWREVDGQWEMTEPAFSHLKWHLPVLHNKHRFNFPDDREVFWEHRLDIAASDSPPTILFARDPRDAIYSLHQRNYAGYTRFVYYLNRPDEWPDHFPRLFQLPPFETFAYFFWFWLAMGKMMPLKVVRFEDVKVSPLPVLRDVLHFLSVERSEGEILQAIESSGFEKARHAMETMERETGRVFKTVRKGQVGEWKDAYSLFARRCIRKVGKGIIKRFSYSCPQDSGGYSWLYDDCHEILARNFSEDLAKVLVGYLSRVKDGDIPSVNEIADCIVDSGVRGTALIRFAGVIEAIYYIENIFDNTSIPQARVALDTFVNLNLHYSDQWPIQIAAWHCVKRLNERSGKNITGLLGGYWSVKIRRLHRLWGSIYDKG